MINANAILEINKTNLLHNYKIISKLANNSLTGATIKANAYGLGDIEVLKILMNAGCKHFFLATNEEAMKIRRVNKKVNLYILNGIENNSLSIFKKYNLIPIINSKEEIDILINSKLLETNFKFGIQIETGLNRLGILHEDIDRKIFKNTKLELLISHLASAEQLKNKYNQVQNMNFVKSFNLFKSIKYKSLCSSAGVMNNKNLHYDMIRPGISLYGCADNDKLLKKNRIKPVIVLKGKILQIKIIKKGEYIGYNQTYLTNRKKKIAIIGLGYADGISRLLSNKGSLYYKKDSYKIIGRVSMDSLTVDITNSNYLIKVGHYMEIINHHKRTEKLARSIGTISNEILTSISKRVKRVYI